MAKQRPSRLGEEVRRLRKEAGLSIARLADEAGLAQRTISNLERGEGNAVTRRTTVAAIASALGLDEEGETWLWQVAQGQPVPSRLTVARMPTLPYTLPRDIGTFVGRSDQLDQLIQDASGADIATVHVITGMGGVGKTVLAVHAAHKLAAHFPDGQMYLRLSGHAPNVPRVAPEDALASLLEAAGIGGEQIPASIEGRAGRWRSWLAGRRVLLLLDDAIDIEQVQPLLPGTAGSAVLVTSRTELIAPRDTQRIHLDVLTPGESADLLLKLAGRPELDRADSGIEDIARLCENLPLALGMLGSQLHSNPAWTPADLASELTQARDLPEEIHDGQETVGAALGLSYRDLTGEQQRIFRRLGLHPGTDVDTFAAAALDDTSPDEARHRLRALCAQNVLTQPRYDRYRFHALIRALAEKRARAEDPANERDAAVGRLLDYYVHAAAAANRHLARRTPAREPGAGRPAPAHLRELANRRDALSWMAAERLNLAAATEYAAGNGYPAHAVAIAASMHGFLRSQGYWAQASKLHRTALAAARQLGDPYAEAGALTDLGDVQYLMGEHSDAEVSLTDAVALASQLGDQRAEAGALVELGILQQNTGELAAAEACLTRALELSAAHGDQLGQANALANLGAVQFITGKLTAAADNQKQALAIYRSLDDQLGEARALNVLGAVRQAIGDSSDAAASLTRAAELYHIVGDRIGEANATGNLGAVQCLMEDWTPALDNLTTALALYRELVSKPGEADTLTNLGALHRRTGDYAEATARLTEAIELYGVLSDPFAPANALSELGLVQQHTGDYPAAIASLTRAVELAHAAGEHASEAEARNNLGDVCIDAARDTYTRALDIAKSIGVPLEQARAQEGTGRLLLQSGERAAGIAMLRQARATYQRIGSADADRVARTFGL